MKKASIAIVLILAVVLVAGIACDGITPCTVCGKYVLEYDKTMFIQLESDGTVLTQGSYGTWEQDGNQIIFRMATGSAGVYILNGNILSPSVNPNAHYVKE